VATNIKVKPLRAGSTRGKRLKQLGYNELGLTIPDPTSWVQDRLQQLGYEINANTGNISRLDPRHGDSCGIPGIATMAARGDLPSDLALIFFRDGDLKKNLTVYLRAVNDEVTIRYTGHADFIPSPPSP
jgi:hypothetical protein